MLGDIIKALYKYLIRSSSQFWEVDIVLPVFQVLMKMSYPSPMASKSWKWDAHRSAQPQAALQAFSSWLAEPCIQTLTWSCEQTVNITLKYIDLGLPVVHLPSFSTSDLRASVSSVQSLSRVRLFATPWIAARQASLSITNSRSSPRLTSIESVIDFI